MFRSLAHGCVLALAFCTAASAAPNRTPTGEGGGQSCRCTCMTLGKTIGGFKTQAGYTGTRADCQSLNGAACRLDKPDKEGNNYGSASSCDIILVRPKPKGGVIGPRPGLLKQ